MSRSSRYHLSLDQIRARHPGYQIDRDARRDPPRYHAATHDLSFALVALISDDLTEVDELLTAAAGGEAMAVLRAAYPGWVISRDWIAAGSGPDRRVLTAARDGVTVSALDAEALAEKMTAAARAR